MIDNEYVCELSLDLDYELLTQIALSSNSEPGLQGHQRNVMHYEYLKSLQSKYTILGSLWNVYTFRPNNGLGPHIDAKRLTTLNIPIIGTTESITRFYKFSENPNKEFIPTQALYRIEQPGPEVFNFVLLKPTLINTAIPHSALAGNVTRHIISWSIPTLSFGEAKDYFKSMSVC
jgi:hypothetical protein